jgi:hypothetical protein
MSKTIDPAGEPLEDILRKAHAEDVGRARVLLDAALAAADAQWVPRNATVEALLGLLAEIRRPSGKPPRLDA